MKMPLILFLLLTVPAVTAQAQDKVAYIQPSNVILSSVGDKACEEAFGAVNNADKCGEGASISDSGNLILRSSQSIRQTQPQPKSLQISQPQNEHPRVVSESLEFSHHQSSESSQDIHVRKESTLISKVARPNHYPASSKRHSNRKSNKATHGIQDKAELSDEQMKLDSFKRE
jgi:hypothetical protein